MQLDQCLYCTRFEPVIGQMYEIMNDLGANVAGILDDNQMAYSNMDKYVEQNRSEKYHTTTEKAKIDLTTVKQKNQAEAEPFASTWGKGIAMDWKLVPVEDQKTHINWRQSINDDGSALKRLASWYGNATNAGANIVGGNLTNSIGDKMKKNKEAMDGNSNSKIQSYIDPGKSYPVNLDEIQNRLKDGWMQHLQELSKANSGIDPLTIGIVAYVDGSTDLDGIAKKLGEIESTLGVKNPPLTIAAYKCGIETIMGNDKLPRIDDVVNPDSVSSSGSSGSSGSGKTAGKTFKDHNGKEQQGETYHLNWDNRDTWYYTEFAEPLAVNNTANGGNADNMTFFPKVCYAYCSVLPLCVTSEYDGDWAAFPFTQDQLSGGGEFDFTSKYGERDGRIHHGIDIQCAHGTEIHAVQDGTVVDPSGWGPADCNAVIIQHENNIVSKYLHNSEICVSPGQTVSKGDVVSKVGGWGGGHDGTYPDHLHLEIGTNGLAGSDTNPITYYPKLADCEPERGNHWYDLVNHSMH